MNALEYWNYNLIDFYLSTGLKEIEDDQQQDE